MTRLQALFESAQNYTFIFFCHVFVCLCHAFIFLLCVYIFLSSVYIFMPSVYNNGKRENLNYFERSHQQYKHYLKVHRTLMTIRNIFMDKKPSRIVAGLQRILQVLEYFPANKLYPSWSINTLLQLK